MGLPLRKLVCASNENNVLYDFIQTGTYDISGRAFKLTASPAMDILVSSNLERLLFELSGHDATAVTTWMHDLGSTGRFTVDDATKQALQEQFLAGWADDAACFETIYRTYDKYSYLLDPHTAVAVNVNDRLSEHPVPTIVVSTAHWAKFGPDVWRALHGLEPGAALPAEVGALSALEIDQRISSEYEAPIPEAIAALEGAQVRFDDVSGGSREELENVVLRQLEAWK
jgi:threonine synthase